uniref:Syntaxin-binding protein 4-like n=1 Tax=Saccoglossus kowalevskii TaxID=10224 RepID=A0ABM0M006_SACKO|nr:PREDICTED: syntaxin-binding protein 4-like [Saccoglossus kowalevskii]
MTVTRNNSTRHEYSQLCESQENYSYASSSFSDSRSLSSIGTSTSADPGRRTPASETSASSELTVESVRLPNKTPTLRNNLHRREDLNYINITKNTGLGISIIGGINRPEGPAIFVDTLLQGGDCYKDGNLKPGDQLVTVNGENMINITNEDAKAILTRLKLRSSPSTEIAYARGVPYKTLISQPLMLPTSPTQGNLPYSQHSNSSHPVHSSSHSPLPIPSQHAPVHSPIPSHQSSVQHVSPPQLQSSRQPFKQSGNVTLQHQGVSTPLSPITMNGHPSIPAHLHKSLYMQPKMTSTPHTTNGAVMPPPASHPNLPGFNSLGQSFASGVSPLGQPSPVSGTPMAASSTRHLSRSRRLSLDPHVRLKVEKLEVALKYLGLEPTAEQKQELRQKLRLDANGQVSYGDFVQTARDIFKFQLDDHGKLFFAAHDFTDFTEPPPIQHHHTLPTFEEKPTEDLEALKMERDEALREVERLKSLLREKERSCNIAEEELLRIRREAQGAIHESRSLRSKVHLAEQAQMSARRMEVDYEEVVKLLENEIKELRHIKAAAAAPRKQEDTSEFQKRLAVLSGQLRKAEVSKKTYEVSTERLLQFAELVHETLSDGTSAASASARSRGESARRIDNGAGSRPPGYLSKYGRKGTIDLAIEARDTVKAVKQLIEVDSLPYGWEESYTTDGMRYYINHVTQCTTWQHPVTNVQPISSQHPHPSSSSSSRHHHHHHRHLPETRA